MRLTLRRVEQINFPNLHSIERFGRFASLQQATEDLILDLRRVQIRIAVYHVHWVVVQKSFHIHIVLVHVDQVRGARLGRGAQCGL